MKLPWTDLSPRAKRGLLAHGLHWQAVAVGQLYVSIFLFRLSHGYAAPAWHAFCSYLTVPVGYTLGAYLTRRWGPGVSYRCGLLVYALFEALILWMGDGSLAWCGSLGLWWGLGVGLYWQAWVLLIMDLSTEGGDRDAMMGSNQALYFLSNLIAAPITGWALSRFSGTSGYLWAFALSLTLFSAAAWVSVPLRGRPHPGKSALLRLLKTRKPEGWSAIFVSAALMGVMSVGALFLPMLLAYEVGHTETLGGLYALGTALFGFVAASAVGRWGSPQRRGGFMQAAALAVLLLCAPLLFQRSLLAIALYGLGMAVHMGLFNVPVFAVHIRLIEAHPRFAHRRADAMALRELGIASGRCSAAAAVLWGVHDISSQGLTWVIVGVALSPLMNYLVMRPHLNVR